MCVCVDPVAVVFVWGAVLRCSYGWVQRPHVWGNLRGDDVWGAGDCRKPCRSSSMRAGKFGTYIVVQTNSLGRPGPRENLGAPHGLGYNGMWCAGPTSHGCPWRGTLNLRPKKVGFGHLV